MTCEPDRRSNVFFSPPAHLCAVTCITELVLFPDFWLNVTNPLNSNAELTTNITNGHSWDTLTLPQKESASPEVSTSVEWIYPNTNVPIHITKHVLLFSLFVCLPVCLLSTLTISITLNCKKKRLHFRHRCHFQWHSIAQWDSYKWMILWTQAYTDNNGHIHCTVDISQWIFTYVRISKPQSSRFYDTHVAMKDIAPGPIHVRIHISIFTNCNKSINQWN